MFKKLKHWLIWKRVAWLYKQPWTGLFRLICNGGIPVGIVQSLDELPNGELRWLDWKHSTDPIKTSREVLGIRYNLIRKRRLKRINSNVKRSSLRTGYSHRHTMSRLNTNRYTHGSKKVII